MITHSFVWVRPVVTLMWNVLKDPRVKCGFISRLALLWIFGRYSTAPYVTRGRTWRRLWNPGPLFSFLWFCLSVNEVISLLCYLLLPIRLCLARGTKRNHIMGPPKPQAKIKPSPCKLIILLQESGQYIKPVTPSRLQLTEAGEAISTCPCTSFQQLLRVVASMQLRSGGFASVCDSAPLPYALSQTLECIPVKRKNSILSPTFGYYVHLLINQSA